MKLVFDPIYSWWVVTALVAVLLAMVLLVYPRRVAHLPGFYRLLLIGLRLAAALVLALAMLRPAIRWEQTDDSRAVLAVLTDASRSTRTEDGPGGLSRRAAILKSLEETKDLFEELGEKVDIQFYDFANTLTPVETPAADADGGETAIGDALERLLEENPDTRIALVLLFSDGAQRTLSSGTDPRRAAREYALEGVPIYTIGYGGAGLSDVFDVVVEDLLVDPLVFEKKTVPVSARIRVQGAAGRKLTVRLLVEDRDGLRPGEPGRMEPAPPSGQRSLTATQVDVQQNDEVIPVDLSYVPQRPGEFKIAVEVVPLDGELKQQNNRRETIITVKKGGINIAYFNKPLSTEQKFLRAMSASEKIQVEFFDIRLGGLSGRTEIDPEMFEPDRYDAYIIGDVPAEAFGPKNLELLADRVRSGAGLMMAGGLESFGPGGYGGTPLAGLLPVEMRSSGGFDPADHLSGELQMVPTPSGLRHFVMRLSPSETQTREQWEKLPPLEGGNRLVPKRGALVQVLAVAEETGDPLLLYHEVGQSRVMAFAADSTFQWYLGGQQELHQRFWRQVILYLARKELDTEQQVWVRVDPRNFAPGQLVPVTFGARDEEGEPISDAAFTVEVLSPDGEKYSLSPQTSSTGNSADFTQASVSGDYWVRVAATKEGNPIGFDGWTRFIVDRRDLELDNPAADLALLEEIARLSGGSSMPPEGLPDFLGRLVDGKGFSAGGFTQYRQTTLWDNWYFLLLFVALMTAEWLVRKMRGLV